MIKEPKILNLEQILELHSILGKYIDKEPENTLAVDFIGNIIEKMKIHPVNYLNCLSILSGITLDEIKSEDFMDYLICFINGLSINKYFEFVIITKQTGLS